MPGANTDPARLKGEALNNWYRRTPDEVEAERRAADEHRYRDYFEGPQPTIKADRPVRTSAADPDVLWVANGYGGYRAVRPGQPDYFAGEPGDAGDYPPSHAAAPEDGELVEIGNPHNRRLRREYIRQYGAWPQTPEGRNYDVAHIEAIGDGGTNTLGNIRPMHPDDHRAEHMRNNDFRRWGARAHQNRQVPPAPTSLLPEPSVAAPRANPSPAIDGHPKPAKPRATTAARSSPAPEARRVPPGSVTSAARPAAPPSAPSSVKPKAAVKPRPPATRGRAPGGSLGALALLPALTGLMSGRIRLDKPEHFWFDMAGHPAPDDPLPDLYL